MSAKGSNVLVGLVLGSEEFVSRIRFKLKHRALSEDQPSLKALRRLGKADPNKMEAAVRRRFKTAGPARKRRLFIYAQRVHSRLRPAEIAQRYDRTRGAVTLAVQHLDAEAEKNRELRLGLARLARELGE